MNKGRVLISGDAAHATSPHKGSGAGMAIEDSAVLAELIADDKVHSLADLETAFAVFDEVRKERGQWLVRASRRAGDLYEWRAEGVGCDFKKIEDEINSSNAVIAEVDVRRMAQEAKEVLQRRLGSAESRSQL